MKLNYTLIILCFILAVSCQSSTGVHTWKTHYIPHIIGSKSTYFLYEQSLGNVSSQRLVKKSMSNKHTLQTLIFNEQFELEQRIIEEIRSQGSRIKKYTVYIDDKEIEAQVENPSCMSFVPMEKQEYIRYQVEYMNPKDSSINTILKVRRFKGENVVDNKHYIEFYVNEKVENTRKGTLAYTTQGFERYEQGKGLTYQEKIIERDTLRKKLIKIYDKKEASILDSVLHQNMYSSPSNPSDK